jgi:hypothetical protein
MERLTSREPRISGMPGVCCTHFEGGDCQAIQGHCADGCAWEEAAWERLAAYEDTGLKPEDIDALQKREQGLAEMLVNVSCGCAVPYTRLAELAQAEKDGRLVMLPDAKYTDADGENALQKAMWVCGNTNNPVTRYTADAIAEKLCREARDENPPLTLEELREMDGEPVWIEWGGHPQAGWALVRVWSKASNIVYLTYHNGNMDLLGFVLNDGGKIYRRRTEENV